MKAYNRLTFIACVFIVSFVAGVFVLLYVSLIPFFHQIGIAATALLILMMGCAAVLAVSFTFNHVGIMAAKRRHAILNADLLVHGEVVAYRSVQGTLVHLSAEHERAKVVQALPSPKDEEETPAPWFDEATVLELKQQGIGEQTIAHSLNTTRHQVRKVLAAYEARQNGRPVNAKK